MQFCAMQCNHQIITPHPHLNPTQSTVTPILQRSVGFPPTGWSSGGMAGAPLLGPCSPGPRRRRRLCLGRGRAHHETTSKQGVHSVSKKSVKIKFQIQTEFCAGEIHPNLGKPINCSSTLFPPSLPSEMEGA